MIALSILAIALSIGAIALCAHIDFLHMKEDEGTSHLLEQHFKIMHHDQLYRNIGAEDKETGGRG